MGLLIWAQNWLSAWKWFERNWNWTIALLYLVTILARFCRDSIQLAGWLAPNPSEADRQTWTLKAKANQRGNPLSFSFSLSLPPSFYDIKVSFMLAAGWLASPALPNYSSSPLAQLGRPSIPLTSEEKGISNSAYVMGRTHVRIKGQNWNFFWKLTQPRIIFTSSQKLGTLYTGMRMTYTDRRFLIESFVLFRIFWHSSCISPYLLEHVLYFTNIVDAQCNWQIELAMAHNAVCDKWERI